MSDLRQRLLEAFRAESAEHLAFLRAHLGDSGDHVDEMLRRAHSLKGAARAVDLKGVETLAHRLETAFARLRAGSAVTDADFVRVAAAVLDAVEDLVRLEAPEAEAPAHVLRALGSWLGDGDGPQRTETGATGVQPARTGAADGGDAHAVATTVRVRAAGLDRLLDSAAQVPSEGWRQDAVAGDLRAATVEAVALQTEVDRFRRQRGHLLRRLSADPETRAVARFVDDTARRLQPLAGRLRDARFHHGATLRSLRQLGQRLQEDLRETRMVAAAELLGGFGPMLRDLAGQQGKQVDYRMTGLHQEADRRVLQQLRDPVIHLLRNAVGHGIEDPAERLGQGKAAAGRVELSAATDGGVLRLAVRDDGAGVDLDAVARRAGRAGPVDTRPTDDELTERIFAPGFTTTDAVSDLSGRGMGLSVVCEAVASLQGHVEVQRQEPGTRFVLTVPLSIASVSLVLVACAGQTYAFPAHGVQRLLRLREADVESVEGAAVFRVDGDPVPLFGLPALLGSPEPAVRAGRDAIPVLLLRGLRAGIAVDTLVAVRDGFVRRLDLPGTHASYLAGTQLLEDGSLALVLNPELLLKQGSGAAAGTRFQHAPAAGPPPPSRILVVDDSLTTRSLEKSILEAHGYQVILAEDGLVALDILRSQAVDLMVSDIEMPRLDGLALLRAVKADEVLRALPVILVTSHADDGHRNQGLELGAAAYVVKQKFDQRGLLETIEQLL